MDKNKQQTVGPGLYLVSTPIGNMEDITFRALNILKKSDIILCEDTRRSGKLLAYFKIKNELQSYHKFNEEKKSNKIINAIKNKKVTPTAAISLYSLFSSNLLGLIIEKTFGNFCSLK